jgi:FkbM family methyltransferase
MIIFKSHQAVDYIARYLPHNPSVVEAGAYVGTDTARMATRWPDGIIHAFEPVPELYAQLQQTVANFQNVHTYPVALSTTQGTADFYIGEKVEKPGRPTQAGSLHKPKERLLISPIQFPRTITVPTITLDAWALEHHIQSIDMLWLDLQGHELSVLQSSLGVLASLQVILIEVAFIEAYKDQPSANSIIDFLTLHGFEMVGKDFADKPIWFFGNILFVKRRSL